MASDFFATLYTTHGGRPSLVSGRRVRAVGPQPAGGAGGRGRRAGEPPAAGDGAAQRRRAAGDAPAAAAAPAGGAARPGRRPRRRGARPLRRAVASPLGPGPVSSSFVLHKLRLDTEKYHPHPLQFL